MFEHETKNLAAASCEVWELNERRTPKRAIRTHGMTDLGVLQRAL